MAAVFVILVSMAAVAVGEVYISSERNPNNCTLRNMCALQHLLTNIRYQNCLCDWACSAYGDCCHDAPAPPPSRPPPRLRVTPSCRRVINLDWRRDVYITDSCPGDFHHDYIRNHCEDSPLKPPSEPVPTEQAGSLVENLFDYVPVSGTDSNVLYKNVFCALCNGDVKFQFWQLKISSKIQFDPEIFTNQSALSGAYLMALSQRGGVQLQSEELEARPCKAGEASCPDDWPLASTRHGCETGPMARVFHKLEHTRIYKNEACATCHGENSSWLQCDDPADYTTSLRPPFRPLPFSILLDFNRRQGGTLKADQVGFEYRQLDTSCHPDLIYNPMTGACETFVCEVTAIHLIDDTQVLDGCSSSDGPWNASSAVVGAVNASYELVWKFDVAQSYLTLVGNVLSILGCATQLTIYSVLPSLRNPPGVCLMALCGSLGLAQLLFLLAAPLAEATRRAGCVFAACLTHYGFLAYFFWMSVMAYDVWRAFTSPAGAAGGRSSSSARSRLLRFAAYAAGAPAAIVLAALVTDLTAAGWRPNYAAGGVCWLGSRVGLLLWFAVPLFLVLVIDTVLFSLTVHAIRAAAESAKMATKHDQSRLWLYIKLACIMGLTWIFGFVAALSGVTAMWYIFIILNSSQGVFICVTFCCTKKVYRLLRDKLRRLRGGATTTKSTASSGTGHPHSTTDSKTDSKTTGLTTTTSGSGSSPRPSNRL